jgi:hypothetical protein
VSVVLSAERQAGQMTLKKCKHCEAVVQLNADGRCQFCGKELGDSLDLPASQGLTLSTPTETSPSAHISMAASTYLIRPTGVTVVSSILIIASVMGLLAILAAVPFYSAVLAKNSLLVFMLLFVIVDAVGMLLSGVFMLKGANWARLLYIGLGGLNVLIGILKYGFTPRILPSLVIYAVLTVVLSTNKSSDFFASGAGARASHLRDKV